MSSIAQLFEPQNVEAGSYVKFQTGPSGLNWVLEDEEWHALEKDGWEIEWAPSRIPAMKGDINPHNLELGSLATIARLREVALEEAIERFEKATGYHRNFAMAHDWPQPFYFSLHNASGLHLAHEPNECIVPDMGPVGPIEPTDDYWKE